MIMLGQERATTVTQETSLGRVQPAPRHSSSTGAEKRGSRSVARRDLTPGQGRRALRIDIDIDAKASKRMGIVHIVIGIARGFVRPRTSPLILAQRVLP
jgi:hypothetical protein